MSNFLRLCEPYLEGSYRLTLHPIERHHTYDEVVNVPGAHNHPYWRLVKEHVMSWHENKFGSKLKQFSWVHFKKCIVDEEGMRWFDTKDEKAANARAMLLSMPMKICTNVKGHVRKGRKLNVNQPMRIMPEGFQTSDACLHCSYAEKQEAFLSQTFSANQNHAGSEAALDSKGTLKRKAE